MKKTFLSVGLCVLFLLFSGCIHGSLDIAIPDGITTRMSGEQSYTWYFSNDAIYSDRIDKITGTFKKCDCGDCECDCEYTVTEAILTYVIEDSYSLKTNKREYSFEISGKCECECECEETLKIEMSLSEDDYGYKEFCGTSFVLSNENYDEAYIEKFIPDLQDVSINCTFNRKSE